MFDGVPWSAVVLALISAISPLVGVGLSHYFLLRTKKVELDALAKLRARELMFSAYQQDLERIGVEAKERWEILGQGIAQVLSAGNDEDKEKSLGEFLDLLRRFDLNMKDSIDEMENQLKRVGLFEQAKKDTLFLREHLIVDPQTLTTHALEELMFSLITAQTIETRIRLALTSKRRNELFGPYLND